MAQARMRALVIFEEEEEEEGGSQLSSLGETAGAVKESLTFTHIRMVTEISKLPLQILSEGPNHHHYDQITSTIIVTILSGNIFLLICCRSHPSVHPCATRMQTQISLHQSHNFPRRHIYIFSNPDGF